MMDQNGANYKVGNIRYFILNNISVISIFKIRSHDFTKCYQEH